MRKPYTLDVITSQKQSFEGILSRTPYWPRENQKIPTSLRGIRLDFPVKKLATRFFSGGNQDPEFPQGSLGGAIPEYTQNGQSG